MNMLKCLVLWGCLLITGCGYHVPGQGDDWVGKGERRLYIELFANRTTEPYLENFVTSEVVQKFSGSRLVDLTEERADAQLVLSGTVIDFFSSAEAYNATDSISEYRAGMTIKARLVRQATGEVLWQGDLRRDEDFPGVANKILLIEAQTIALKVASRRLAEDLYARLLADF